MRESGLFRNLGRFFTIFSQDAVSAELALQFQSSLDDIESCKSICGAREGLKDIYEQAVKVVEREAAASGYREDLLQLQRALYVELEYLLSFGDSGPRHHFLIVIPVADRPGLLRSCLESLIEQCQAFQYGSFSSKKHAPGERPPIADDAFAFWRTIWREQHKRTQSTARASPPTTSA